tara:strand:- start:5202 stop:5675 length:474 start_codon:yes stop_codon:yes gene_type:complete
MIYLLFTLIINIPIENNLKKGIRKYNKGKYNEAISILLKTKSKNFEYFFYLGHSYSFNDRNELSIVYYDSAIYLNNKNDKAFFERGYSNFVIGNSKKALEDLDEAIKLNPHNAKYYINRGSIKYDLGLVDSACKDWNQAMVIDKNLINNSIILMNCN